MQHFVLPARIVRCFALGLFLVTCACSDETRSARPVELTVYAASSTRDAITALDALFEADGKTKIVVNFGSSGDLARQIVAAGKTDVFLSADDKEMDRVEQQSLLVPGSRAALLSNQLVVIVPNDTSSPSSEAFTPEALASVKHLSLANVESVPAGRYAKAWLESKSVWSNIESKVLPAVDVRAALAAVESGAAEAGIVYRTDAARSSKARVWFAVPVAEGPRISYPVAAVAGRGAIPVAQAYLDFLRSDRARALWEKEGFIVIDSSPPAKKN